MEFKSGMLGCCVIMLMLGAAIFGTILLSADTNTYDVTKYRFETEVTGLFPVDNSPEYMDYDLSKNYTGYYTPDTIVNGVKYWGGANFTPSITVNNYSIKYHPDNSNTTTATIDYSTNVDNMTDSIATYTGITWYNHNFDGNFNNASQSKTKSLSSFLTVLNLTGYEVIEVKSDIADGLHNCLFFGTANDFGTGRPGQQSQINAACYVENSYYTSYSNDPMYHIACHSCKIDNITQTATFYYDDSTMNASYVRAVPLDDAVVSFTTINAQITFDVVEYDINQIDYMDISKGVTITGVTE